MLLNDRPFTIMAGEMHPARIPAEYWRHRVKMAAALGLNAISMYVFWNHHERADGTFDFTSGNRDIAAFIRICHEEGMKVLFRPGPYVCGEWDFGGLPPRLLKIPDIQVRCMDSRYIEAAEHYMDALAAQIRPLMAVNGGPIILVQIENEFGSYGTDKAYLRHLQQKWENLGIGGPFYTADGLSPGMLATGTVAGAAVGFDPLTSEDINLGFDQFPDTPVFGSEIYSGWLTHVGESWQAVESAILVTRLSDMLERDRGFSIYVLHGGTNFGFSAGANIAPDGQFQPDVTSYDYDAPINEQGAPTEKYFAIREMMAARFGELPTVPEPVPSMEFPPVEMIPFASIWDNLPQPVKSIFPLPMEALGQDCGLILYRTRLVGRTSGELILTELHDYATIFVDGEYIGDVRRGPDPHAMRVILPETASVSPVLDILVYAYGRVNFGEHLLDRKGITQRVSLEGQILMNWEIFNLPLEENSFSRLSSIELESERPGYFFRGVFELSEVADTFVVTSEFECGIAWVNRHNLGRYDRRGPQHELYCPASWLNKGQNEILFFDMTALGSRTTEGKKNRPKRG
jgi:hypothetical protein